MRTWSQARVRLGAICVALALVAPILRALPSDYFPAGTPTPTDLAGWEALAERFPNRVRVGSALRPDDQEEPPATRLELRPGITYVRVRQMGRDQPMVQASLEVPSLIIDLRFVAGGLEESLSFGSLLARVRFELPPPTASADSPLIITPSGRRSPGQRTIVLVNRETSGPLEAVLAGLQQAGEVLLVGTATAGNTGLWHSVEEFPTIRVVVGELIATPDGSLLDRGVASGLFLTISESEDHEAYAALDSGTSVEDLLNPPVGKARFDEAALLQNHRGATPHPQQELTSRPASTASIPLDRILQRGINVVIALEALSRTVR